MANRWDEGKPSLGDSFDPGFVSPWNQNVRNYSDFETLGTIPPGTHYDTMESQMDGDQNTSWTAGGGKRRKK